MDAACRLGGAVQGRKVEETKPHYAVEGGGERCFILQNLASSTCCEGAHHEVEHRPQPKVVLAGKERNVEGKKHFPPVDVVHLNENRGNMETEH